MNGSTTACELGDALLRLMQVQAHGEDSSRLLIIHGSTDDQVTNYNVTVYSQSGKRQESTGARLADVMQILAGSIKCRRCPSCKRDLPPAEFNRNGYCRRCENRRQSVNRARRRKGK